MDHFDAAWSLGPGNAALWNTTEHFNASTDEFLAYVWETKQFDRGPNPSFRSAFYARDVGAVFTPV